MQGRWGNAQWYHHQMLPEQQTICAMEEEWVRGMQYHQQHAHYQQHYNCYHYQQTPQQDEQEAQEEQEQQQQ